MLNNGKVTYMAEYLVGELIKKLRKEKRITQAALCEGLCTSANLSRIEQGKQGLDKYLFNSLMQRLGEDPNNYFANFISVDKFEINRKMEEVIGLIMNEEYEKVGKEVDGLEDKEYFKSKLVLQFIMFTRAAVRINLEGIDVDIIEYLLSAIEITRKNFDLDKVADYVLTRMEIDLINMIAIVYSSKGNMEKSVQILNNIVKNAESNYTDDFEKAKIHMLVMYNLSKCLGLLGRYDESVEICDKAIRIGVNNNNMRLLPKIVYNKAWCLYYLGDKKTCESLLHEAYYSARMQRNFKFSNNIVEKAQNNFGIEIIMK